MMGWAAAFDMARTERVEAITLADNDESRLSEAVERISQLTGTGKITAVKLDAADPQEAQKVMRGHDGVLSAVPYFLNLELAKAAIAAGCHFADLGGNNTSGEARIRAGRRGGSRRGGDRARLRAVARHGVDSGRRVAATHRRPG